MTKPSQRRWLQQKALTEGSKTEEEVNVKQREREKEKERQRQREKERMREHDRERERERIRERERDKHKSEGKALNPVAVLIRRRVALWSNVKKASCSEKSTHFTAHYFTILFVSVWTSRDDFSNVGILDVSSALQLTLCMK